MEKVAGTTENSDANAKIKIRKLSSKLSSIASSQSEHDEDQTANHSKTETQKKVMIETPRGSDPHSSQFERDDAQINLDDELLEAKPEEQVETKKEKPITVMTNTLSHEDYSFFYENSVWEQYEDLVYAIQRGKVDEAVRIYKQEGISIDEALRPVSPSHNISLVRRHCAAHLRGVWA